MKTYRIIIAVLLLLVLLLAYLQFSSRGKVAGEPKEMWHTNTVELWHTNTVATWATNTVELWRTNTELQTVTNEIVKEVPARLSELERRAALLGFKHLNAPLVQGTSDALYKASPIAVDVVIDENAAKMLTDNAGATKQRIQEVLRSHGISVAEQSPCLLRLKVNDLWATDVPRVTLFAFRLELGENVAIQRQNDVLGCPGIVWSTADSKLARTVNVDADVNASIQDQLDKFCRDCLKAKEEQKAVESRIPVIPANFLNSQSGS